jgi:hypothetical protein
MGYLKYINESDLDRHGFKKDEYGVYYNGKWSLDDSCGFDKVTIKKDYNLFSPNDGIVFEGMIGSDETLETILKCVGYLK